MLYSRFISSSIQAALMDSPVLMIIGARQTGKTTLVRHLAETVFQAHYFSLDDITIRGAVQNDPHGFLQENPGALILDEIQLVPDLLSAIKLEVDKDRKPGRFLLTGSANILTLPRISESLAGRVELFTLLPLSQGEINRTREGFIDWIFSEKLVFKNQHPSAKSLWTIVLNGGYPEILRREDFARKQVWFRDYITTLFARDVRDLSRIEGLTQMPRLLELLASRITGLLNYSELSRSLQIPQTTLKRYLALFENIFLIKRLPAWSSNLGKRLVKAEKLFFIDTGLAAYLVGATPEHSMRQFPFAGPLLENFVLSELRKQASWSKIQPHLFHFRNQNGFEVDFILEDRLGRCIGIESKAATTIRQNDFKGLKWLQDNLGASFLRGIILYQGEEIVPFGENLYAVPIPLLWEIPGN